ERRSGDRALGAAHERDLHGRSGRRAVPADGARRQDREARERPVHPALLELRHPRLARLVGEVLAEAAGAGLARPVRAAQARRREVRGRPARADGLPAVREAGARRAAQRMKLEPIVGRYAHIGKQRVYFEEAGQGIPLLCLHTAGSDGRQYRAVLNDAEIARRYRVIAFDMPWHGKSSPPAGWEREDYRLTTERYTGMIMSVARALGLE